MNPIQGMSDSMSQFGVAANPSVTMDERRRAAVNSLAEGLLAVAPAALAARGYMTPAQGVMEGLLGGSPATQRIGDDIGRFMADDFGGVGLGGLPAPRNDAEAMARDILDLRAAGRASEVTDDMMAKADPQYMFNNTPLPMDEASRMARAEEMGFGMSEELYHGTGSDILSVDPRMARMDSEGAGFYTTDDPYTASGYAEIDGVSRGKVYPLAARSDVPHVYADFEGRVWNEFSPEIDPSRFGSTLHHDYDPFGWGDVDPNDLAFDRYSTDDIARSAKIDGHEAAIFENVFDGVGVDAPDYSSTIRADFNPVNIRSRFARFDPEFRHLANLSAGIGGLGLLGYVGNQSSDPLQTPRAE
jgi:hypothetical protein